MGRREGGEHSGQRQQQVQRPWGGREPRGPRSGRKACGGGAGGEGEARGRDRGGGGGGGRPPCSTVLLPPQSLPYLSAPKPEETACLPMPS